MPAAGSSARSLNHTFILKPIFMYIFMKSKRRKTYCITFCILIVWYFGLSFLIIYYRSTTSISWQFDSGYISYYHQISDCSIWNSYFRIQLVWLRDTQYHPQFDQNTRFQLLRLRHLLFGHTQYHTEAQPIHFGTQPF